MVHYLVRKYLAVLTSVDSNAILCSTDISNDILYIGYKYCTVLTLVDSNDMLYRYCTVHYSRTFCHYYINTVQYISYSMNTVQYIRLIDLKHDID